MENILKKRDKSILQSIISSYIITGEPIGSRYLSKQLNITLSPATIRNIMSDLEEMGYLKQPHISAGRVPTDKAYRFYVNCLIKSDTPEETSLYRLLKITRSQKIQPGTLIKETSKVLSEISSYIGLVMSPRFLSTVLKHIEFVKLKKKQVLVILVSQVGLIQNKVIFTDREYSQKELDKITLLLNEKYKNKHLSEVRAKILEEMADEKKLYDSLMEKAIELGNKALSLDVKEEDLYVDGTSKVLSLPEFADAEKMKNLFKAFEEKSHLIDLLDHCIDAQGVKIFIGAENPYHELRDFSLITAPYEKEGSVLGVIGVLGPTRMEYSKVIPIVDQTAKYLSRILTNKF